MMLRATLRAIYVKPRWSPFAYLVGVVVLSLTTLASCNVRETVLAVQPAPVEAGARDGPASVSETAQAPASLPDGPAKVIVYYFHGTVRCQTCLDIEQHARETVFETYFVDLMEGSMEWRSVNYEVPENRHYSNNFTLPYPSLVVVREQAGYAADWKLLGKTWELVSDSAALRDYVRAELGAILADW